MARQNDLLILLTILWIFPLRTIGAERSRVMIINANQGFSRETGLEFDKGVALHIKQHPIGYALLNLKEPLLLTPGTYRFSLISRRGHAFKKGLFKAATPVVRLEIWDHTKHEMVNQRELHWDDYSGTGDTMSHSIDLSMTGRQGHFLEPKVFWYGLANVDLIEIQIHRFADVNLKNLEIKAFRLQQQMEQMNIENGFVVSRSSDGTADETGDATTYTGYYAAALAWKYKVTRDTETFNILNRTLDTLHLAIKGSQEQPIVVRYLDEYGTPSSKSPSKDVYTSFFLAYAAAFPLISDINRQTQMKQDVLRIISEFWNNEWGFMAGRAEFLSLAPYLSASEVKDGIRKVLTNPRDREKILRALKKTQRLIPFGEIWPGAKDVMKAIKKNDEKRLYALVVPTLNGSMNLIDRLISFLQEKYRNDLFMRQTTNPHHPGKRLEQLLSRSRSKLLQQVHGAPIKNLSDVRVLGGNALIALHLLKTSISITRNPVLLSFERKDDQEQPSLIEVADNWYGVEDEFLKITSGNPTADRERKGYLTQLSLLNLIELEKSKEKRRIYQRILEKWWPNFQNEDNPLAHAIALIGLDQQAGDIGLILRALQEYPESRIGLGNDYWQTHAKKIAESEGGGYNDGFSREPLPVSLRPRDSFLWQRSPRRLSGDTQKIYPSTDYLFVYWLCRSHQLFEDTSRPSE